MADADVKQGSWFKRHKILTVVLAFVLIAIIAGVAGGGSDTTNENASTDSNESSTPAEEKPAEVAGIGTAVRDGKFEFVVNGVECGATVLGDNEFLQQKSQGQFCVMDLSVKNIGDEPQTFFSSNQYVFNAEGQKYSNSSSAELAIEGNSDNWLREINPGNSVRGKVVFDIPADQTLATAELHDSAYSGGVKVKLN